VVVNYRPGGPFDAETAQAEAASFATRALAAVAAVSKREDVQQMMEQVLAEFRPYRYRGQQCECRNHEAVSRCQQRRVESSHRRQSVRRLLGESGDCAANGQTGEGDKLIFVSSVHEDIPFPEYTAYCASKGGVRTLMRKGRGMGLGSCFRWHYFFLISPRFLIQRLASLPNHSNAMGSFFT